MGGRLIARPCRAWRVAILRTYAEAYGGQKWVSVRRLCGGGFLQSAIQDQL